MLIKEYRIPMPLSVAEYQRAQRYMIAKKSVNDSSNDEGGAGVEIIDNEPYENGPGGNGQYTRKIYHVGSRLPNWIKSIMPKSALVVYEEAWNAYPYTMTKFSIPAVEKFSIEIETVYKDDDGTAHDNVFNMKRTDLAKREVDFIEMLEDTGEKVEPEEDLRIYVSKKSGRGPLTDGWVKTCNPVMCAYKLCKVNFQYWGLQSKIERFVHDVGLRKVMLHAHQEVWVWQDEWLDLNMDDILKMEIKAQQKLAKLMHENDEDGPAPEVQMTTKQSLTCLANAHSEESSDDEFWDACDTPEDDFGDCLDQQNVSSNSGSHRDSFGYDQEPEDMFTDELPQLSKVLFVFCGPYFLTNTNDTSTGDYEFEILAETLHNVIQSHYTQAKTSLLTIPVSCPPILSPGLTTLLSELNPGNETSSHTVNNPNLSIDTIALLASSGKFYDSAILQTIENLNEKYDSFIAAHPNFEGKFSVLANRASGIVVFDILNTYSTKLKFKVDCFFSLGSPIGLILSHRALLNPDSFVEESGDYLKSPISVSKVSLACREIYNVYQAVDPLASRLEPCLNRSYGKIEPFIVPYFHDFPYGLGDPPAVIDINKYTSIDDTHLKRYSTSDGAALSATSSTGSLIASEPDLPSLSLSISTQNDFNWWGTKRIDICLSSPKELPNMPSIARLYATQGSYMQSRELASFLLRHLVKTKQSSVNQINSMGHFINNFVPKDPVTKFNRKKNKLMTSKGKPRHSARDVIVSTSSSTLVVTAKFVYGRVISTLAGEDIDVHTLTTAGGNWVHLGTARTNEKGKLNFELSERDSRLSIGVYPIVFLVKGDHTLADCRLFIVPPRVNTCIFSIDGSFAASITLDGADPKLQAGALDTVRAWSKKGYFIVYVSSRLDIHQDNVLNWLARHSFPLGAVVFTGAVHAEGPTQHKADVLKNLINHNQLQVIAAYGSHRDLQAFQQVECESIYIVAKKEGHHKKYPNVVYLPQGYVQDHLANVRRFPAPTVAMPIAQESSISARATSIRRYSLQRRSSSNLDNVGPNTSLSSPPISPMSNRSSTSMNAIHHKRSESVGNVKRDRWSIVLNPVKKKDKDKDKDSPNSPH